MILLMYNDPQVQSNPEINTCSSRLISTLLYNTLPKFFYEDCHRFFMRVYFQILSRAHRGKRSPFLRGDCSRRGRSAAGVAASIAKHSAWALLLAMTLTLCACLPVAPALPTVTPVPTSTQPPPTSTTVWFSPSATPTRLAVLTYTATPEMSPGIGSVTLSDDFSDDSLWDTAVSDQGSAAVSHNRLTLAAQPGVYLESMRRDLNLGNFYAEITAHPSLCRGEDSYGILVRGVGLNYYRLILTCNSQVRAERVNSGVKLPIQEPIPSGDAPPGAPGKVQIGVWAVGGDIRLFLNGRYQFGINDKSFPSGTLGVFVRAGGQTPMSVTFSDLNVYEVDYVPPTRTPIP